MYAKLAQIRKQK